MFKTLLHEFESDHICKLTYLLNVVDGPVPEVVTSQHSTRLQDIWQYISHFMFCVQSNVSISFQLTRTNFFCVFGPLINSSASRAQNLKVADGVFKFLISNHKTWRHI